MIEIAETLGGGTMQDRDELRTRASAGVGVNHRVDLHMLQQAEERFGNGDVIFTAYEQMRAFRSPENFLFGPPDKIEPGRRVG